MGCDRSLDEFLSQSDASLDEETDNTTPDTRETGDSVDNEGEEQSATLSVHPVRSTMAWTVDDTTCDACGEVVQRRWRDDDRLVCSACKEW
jgi:formylmethanofuran dehydrogenase subunit E